MDKRKGVVRDHLKMEKCYCFAWEMNCNQLLRMETCKGVVWDRLKWNSATASGEQWKGNVCAAVLLLRVENVQSNVCGAETTEQHPACMLLARDFTSRFELRARQLYHGKNPLAHVYVAYWYASICQWQPLVRDTAR